jgi:hypothetical protein
MTGAAKSRIYPVIVVVLLLVIAAMAYKFVISGSTGTVEVGRVAIILAPAERALVLREMRDFIAGLQLISDALSRDDMKGIAKAAHAMGIAKVHDAPVAMMAKLPIEFKLLAFSVYCGFDTIAMDADGTGTPKHSLVQLSQVLQQCVACRAAYRIEAATTK